MSLSFAENNNILEQSIFSLKHKDLNFCTMLHWAAYKDALFIVKFFWRMGANFQLNDLKGLIPFEKAAQNNAVRVVQFLDSISNYPLKTNYFLKNNKTPVYVNFYPKSMQKINQVYESKILPKSFQRKVIGKFDFSISSFKDFYYKHNLQFRFGIILYIVWILNIIAGYPNQFVFTGGKAFMHFYYFLLSLALCYNSWFFRFPH